MNILIKSATIIDSKSEFHNSTQDLLIENGVITKIASNIENPKNHKEITLDNLHVSQGWFDSSVSFGEPGYEERETIANGLKTAAASGFTYVALNANSNPVIDSNSDITFVNSKSNNNAVTLLPIGALTVGSKGEDLAELFDMSSAGAVAFYDYKKPISNPNLMKIALQYAGNFDGLVCSFPQENKIAGQGVMNENINSTKLGLKGIPALAEELQVARDLFLLEYTGGKLHIPTISTATSVALIRAAKKKKLDVTCSVAIHNLCFTDDVLSDFNTHYKVLPPLRTQPDIDALIEGVKDGTIDMVTTDHNPIETQMQQDAILTLVKDNISIIPRQQYFNNKVKVFTSEEPSIAGSYAIVNKNESVKNVSYNYSRQESNLTYRDLSSLSDMTLSNSITKVFDTIKSETKVNALWKWFVIFALALLIIEMLILKFFK